MGIYKVSFANPHPAPGEDPIDTVDMDELNNTNLNDDSIRQFDDSRTVHIIKYEFGRRQVMPENVEQIFIVASCDSIDASMKPEEILDIPTFVDEVARGAYERKTPDASEYIIEAKTKLKTLFANKLLENGLLSINSRYNSFGYVYSSDDKIGTFENVTINSDREIGLVDLQSIVNLENAQNLSIQVYIDKKYTFLMTVSEMKDDKTVLISSISNIDTSVPEEVLAVKSKDEFNSEEDFWSSRRSMISTNLINDNFSLEDIDLFD